MYPSIQDEPFQLVTLFPFDCGISATASLSADRVLRGKQKMISRMRNKRNEAVSSVSSSEAHSTTRDTLDDALIGLIAAADTVSMKVFYARHNVRIYRFILRLTGNQAVAEELVSDVFLDVWRNATKFEYRFQVSTWLLAVARQKALQVLRRRSTELLDANAAELIEDPSDSAEVTTEKAKASSIFRNC